MKYWVIPIINNANELLTIFYQKNQVSKITPDHKFVNFPKYSSNKEAAFLLIREKSGRFSMYREPFYLDRCVICTESGLVEYFEVHEISSKDSFVFKVCLCNYIKLLWSKDLDCLNSRWSLVEKKVAD